MQVHFSWLPAGRTYLYSTTVWPSRPRRWFGIAGSQIAATSLGTTIAGMDWEPWFFFCRFAIWPFFPGNLKFNQFESKFRISINFFMCDICHYFLAFLGCTCLVFQGRNCNGWWMSWPIKAVGMRPTRTRSGCVARPDAWSSTCISGDHCCRPPWNLGAAWWKFWTPIRYLAEGAEMRSMLGRWCYLDVFWVL